MIRTSGWGVLCVALMLLLSFLFPNPALAGTISFASPRVYGVGVGPWAVAAGDFSGGGGLDLAVINYLTNTISVLAGNGDGTFGVQATYAVGSGPASITAQDVNGDGKLDLVVGNFLSTTVSVLLGNGNGTFQPARNFDAGPNPAFAAVGDFNGDGKPDLAAANYYANTFSVLLGNGDETFQPARLFAAGSGPNSAVARDFNADGKVDLVVADYGPSTQRATTVSVLLGNGDGTFQPPLSFEAGASPAFVVEGDFNFDGVLDLAVANYDGNTVSVLIGAISLQQVATPTFSPTGGTYSSPQSVAISDATPGATIYYTTDGSTPTTASPVYSGPILVAQTTTIKAMAAASGMANSAVASATYTILQQQVATPAFTPGGGTYTTPQSITISDATPGATIYYTTDGSTPTTASPIYTNPVLVTQTTTIKAMAAGGGMANSAVASATYTILQQVATPTFTPGGGTYTSSVTVTISDSTPGATIHYTTDGSTPTTSSPIYTNPVLVTQTG